jgi:AraC family L-rhamnose operon regulatory protein RhaS
MNRLTARYTISQSHVQLSAARPVRAQRLLISSNVPPHDHAYHEICIVLAGAQRALHRTESSAVPMPAGTVIVVPPGDVHAMDRTAGTTVVNLYYLAEWLMADLPALWAEPVLVELFLGGALFKLASGAVSQFRLNEAELATVDAELASLETEWTEPSPSNLILRGSFTKTIAMLGRAWSRDPMRPAFAPSASVWQAMQTIEKRVAENEPMDVSALAEELDLSPGHLAKIFKSALGQGVTNYYQQRRVHRACRSLLDLRKNVTELAYELGYADAPHFCRMFKRFRGMTPREYRKIYVNAERPDF